MPWNMVYIDTNQTKKFNITKYDCIFKTGSTNQPTNGAKPLRCPYLSWHTWEDIFDSQKKVNECFVLLLCISTHEHQILRSSTLAVALLRRALEKS